jgi:hypothetical protein
MDKLSGGRRAPPSSGSVLFDGRRDRGSQKAALTSSRHCRRKDRDGGNCGETEEHPHASGQGHSNAQQEREPRTEEKLCTAARIMAPLHLEGFRDASPRCPQGLRSEFFGAEDHRHDGAAASDPGGG